MEFRAREAIRLDFRSLPGAVESACWNRPPAKGYTALQGPLGNSSEFSLAVLVWSISRPFSAARIRILRVFTFLIHTQLVYTSFIHAQVLVFYFFYLFLVLAAAHLTFYKEHNARKKWSCMRTALLIASARMITFQIDPSDEKEKDWIS